MHVFPLQAAFGTCSQMFSSWQTYPVHAGVFSRSQAYKADLSLLLQGKADSKDVGSLAALVQTKVILVAAMCFLCRITLESALLVVAGPT